MCHWLVSNTSHRYIISHASTTMIGRAQLTSTLNAGEGVAHEAVLVADAPPAVLAVGKAFLVTSTRHFGQVHITCWPLDAERCRREGRAWVTCDTDNMRRNHNQLRWIKGRFSYSDKRKPLLKMKFLVNEQNVSVMYIVINAISLHLDLNIFQQGGSFCSKLGMYVE